MEHNKISPASPLNKIDRHVIMPNTCFKPLVPTILLHHFPATRQPLNRYDRRGGGKGCLNDSL